MNEDELREYIEYIERHTLNGQVERLNRAVRNLRGALLCGLGLHRWWPHRSNVSVTGGMQFCSREQCTAKRRP